jgi:hypothetical protein
VQNTGKGLKVWFVAIVLGLVCLTAQGQAQHLPYAVTNTSDSGDGSLRWAILRANEDPGADTIYFQIPTTDPGYTDGVWTIRLTSPLPLITDAATVISGTSQTFYYGDTNPGGPEIQLLGTGPLATYGLFLESSQNLVHGLAINGFAGAGMVISGTQAISNVVTGNWFSLSPTSTMIISNGVGVYIYASHNTIGGTTAGARNVFAGYDRGAGVAIRGSDAAYNQVIGNYIGVTGTMAIGNLMGVDLRDGAHNNTIGGAASGEGNVIAGNTVGVVITGTGTSLNTVQGNIIGLDPSGTVPVGNVNDGVRISYGASNNIVWGNTIAGNGVGNSRHGVAIWDSGSTGNKVLGNTIGTDAAGTPGLGNGGYGVIVKGGAQESWIGADWPGLLGNVIAGNGTGGVLITGTGTTSTTVWGNFIGVDSTAAHVIPNRGHGVRIAGGAQHNWIGGSGLWTGNVIGGNLGYGVTITGTHTASNTITANYIGVTGTVVISNSEGGVYIAEGAHHNTVGGGNGDKRNFISGNGGDGIHISNAHYNTISGNTIGTDATGAVPLKNHAFDVYVNDCAQNNTIGPGNVIAYGRAGGVRLQDACTQGNAITQNAIYAHTGPGIELVGGANRNVFAPILHTADCLMLTVESWPGWTVEVFTDADDEGQIYLTSVVVPSDTAHATITLTTIPTLPNFTATGTDPSGNTSAFSDPLVTGCRHLMLPLVMKAYSGP